VQAAVRKQIESHIQSQRTNRSAVANPPSHGLAQIQRLVLVRVEPQVPGLEENPEVEGRNDREAQLRFAQREQIPALRSDLVAFDERESGGGTGDVVVQQRATLRDLLMQHLPLILWNHTVLGKTPHAGGAAEKKSLRRNGDRSWVKLVNPSCSSGEREHHSTGDRHIKGNPC